MELQVLSMNYFLLGCIFCVFFFFCSEHLFLLSKKIVSKLYFKSLIHFSQLYLIGNVFT